MTRPFWPAVPVQAECDTVGLGMAVALVLWDYFPLASSHPIISHPVPSLCLASTAAFTTASLHKHQGLAQVLDWDNL